MSLTKSLAVFLVLVVCTYASFAGGYQLNEHGVRAMGMGGAFVAQAADASAVFFNPAGLAFQKGWRIQVGSVLISPSVEFTGPTPLTTVSSMVRQNFLPSHAYISYAMSNGFAFGVGIFTPYGLGTEWPTEWVGRKVAVKSELKTIYVNPTISYRVSDNFSLGLGISYVWGNVRLSYRVPTYSSIPVLAENDGTASLEGDGTAFNVNAGLMYKPTDDLSIGLSYRLKTDVKFDGKATFSNMQALAPFFPGGRGNTTLPMPGNLYAGIAYKVNPAFTMEADFQYVQWSSYDETIGTLESGPAAPPALGGQPLQKSPDPLMRDWEDTYLIRVGGEYRFDKLALRAGYIFDRTPQPDKSVDPVLPDANRNEFTIGFGYELTQNLTVDGVYHHIFSSNRTVSASVNPFPGTYKVAASLFGISIGYQF